MNTLFLYNTKTLKSQINTKIFAGDNHITKINVQLPDNIGGYPKRECEFNLRAIIPEGNMSYIINPNEPYFYITNDITEKAQTVKLMMIITHAGNVIGRTNTVDLQVREPAEAPDPPLTPREEFDEVIAEQRAEIAEQAETISAQTAKIAEKNEEISEKSAQITELSDDVTELTNENTRLETQHDADQNTIQYLINNPPEAKLQSKAVEPTDQMQVVEPDSGFQGLSTVTVGAITPPEPIYIPPHLQPKQVTPSWSAQYIEPDSDYDGLSAVAVDAITAQLVPNLVPENIRKNAVVGGVTGTFDSFPENPVGGIYFYEPDENDNPTKCKIYKWRETTWGSLLKNNLYAYVENVVFEETLITTISANAFENCTGLKNIVFDNSLLNISNSAFRNCTNLVAVEFGNDILTIGANAFRNTGLSSIILPASVQSVSDEAFYGSRLVTAKVFSGVVGNSAFYSCTHLTEIEFGNNVTSIGYQCCLYTALNTVKLSEGLTTIGDWAFGRVPIKTINFPSTLISVGASSFAFCSSLENVTFANGFNCNGLNVSASTRFTAETIVACLEALADRTGQTAYTITFGSTNLNKLTAEQRAIAINKNWNLA